jgi:hypothetical protein
VNIGEKAEHVRQARAAGVHGGHGCHWPGCERKVPPAMWGCTRHWYALPLDLRRRVWRAYQPGQEETKRPSESYLQVAREVQAWIEAHPEAGQPKRQGQLGR